MNKDLTIEIHANTKQAIEDINRLKEEIKHFSKNVDTSNESLAHQNRTLEGVADKVKSLALAYGGFEVVKSVVSTIADFEQSIAKLGAISNASSSEMSLLKDKARELGASTRYSAEQVAEAMNYEAMSGMKTNEILTATKDILNLANVGQLDLAKASDIATDSMSAFGLKAGDVGHITDVMASTITNSNTNVEQLGEAFKNVAPVAKNLGLTIGETSGMLGVLANAGRKGGEAGTHLKIILQRLASTSKPVIKGLKELGISAYDSNGKLKPLTATLHAIQGKLKSLSEQKRNAILKDLFGEEAISSANIILDNLSDMDKLIKKVSNSDGQAADMSKKFNDTLKAQWDTLKSALQELALTIGDDLLPALKSITDGLIAATRGVTEFYKENEALVKTVTELIGVIYGLGKVKAVIQGVIGLEALAGVTSFSGGIVALRVALGALALEAAPIVALGVAIGGVLYYLNELEEDIKKVDEATKALQDSTKSVETLNDKLSEIFVKGKVRDGVSLTTDEIKKLEKSINDTIVAQGKQLEVLHKNSDGSKDYTQKIEALNASQRVLRKELALVQNSEKDLHKNAIESTAKLLDKNKELSEKTKQLSKAELDGISKTYKTRVTQHTEALDQLLNKETTLKNNIIKLNEDLQNKLKSIDNERVASRESLQSKIHNLEMVGSSDIEKYHDKEKQADKALYKAKIALRNGELSEYKRYKSIYEGLVGSIANTEIKDGKRVLISKKESANYGINALKKLSSLENSYYDKKKSEAIKLHNQKIAQIKAELTATKAQILLEVQRLQLEKQLVEATTGKKINIDVSGALNAVKAIDKQIKNLDGQIKKPKALKVDNSQAVSSINKVRSTVLTLKGKTLKIDANTTPADFGIDKLINKQNGREVEILVNPEYEKAERKINEAINGFEKKEVTAKVDANTSKANSSITKMQNVAKKTITPQISANTSKAISQIKQIQSLASKSVTFLVNANASQAQSIIRNLQRNTSSTHTVYVRKVEQHAIGGMVGEVMKLATGGMADFERKQGRIAGYDPTDSDDVPALLTRGEFVIKRDTVAHYGDDFLNKLNNKQVNLPRYAIGGSVGGVSVQQSTNSNNKTVNLNLNMGGKQFKLMSSEEVATALATHLERAEF